MEINTPEDKKIKSKKRFLISYSIWFSIILIIFILTLIFIRRLIVFGSIFFNSSGIIQIISLILYLISLVLLLIYYAYTFTVIIIKSKHNEDWYPEVSNIFSKLDLPSFVFKCISVLLFIFVFMFNPCTVSGSSMEDTFKNNDRIIASSFTSIKNNDVIIFDASNYSANVAFYIKRVVASEGDEISYIGNNLYVNGKEDERGNVSASQYIHLMNSALKLSNQEESNVIKSVIIPENKYLVLGDNRSNSLDSRFYGLVDRDDIYGEVIIRFYPFDKFEWY